MVDLIVYNLFKFIYICVLFTNSNKKNFFLSLLSLLFHDFVGISSTNLREISLVHLGEPRGLKSVLLV